MKQTEINANLDRLDGEILDQADSIFMYKTALKEARISYEDDAGLGVMEMELSDLQKEWDRYEMMLGDEEFDIPEVEPKVAPNKIGLHATQGFAGLIVVASILMFMAGMFCGVRIEHRMNAARTEIVGGRR